MGTGADEEGDRERERYIHREKAEIGCVSGVYYVWREQGFNGRWRESVDEIAHGLGSGVYRRGPSKLASRAEQKHRSQRQTGRPEERHQGTWLVATCNLYRRAFGER